MLKKIFRSTSLIFTAIFLTFLLFSEWASAENTYTEDYGNNSIGTTIESPKEIQSLEKEEVAMDEINMDELFGDKQVFPFAAGLDSY